MCGAQSNLRSLTPLEAPALPSPAQRGKVPQAEGGRLLILMIQSKIKSAPSAPSGAASPALRGKRRHEFQIAAPLAVPSPAQQGKRKLALSLTHEPRNQRHSAGRYFASIVAFVYSMPRASAVAW